MGTEQSVASFADEDDGDVCSDSDSEELLPEAPKRAYSVPVTTTQPAFMSMSAGKGAAQEGKNSDKLELKRK